MKLLKRTAALFVGALMASQAAHAQSSVVANDLYLGFENTAGNGSTADYIINLGSASSLIGASTPVNLSSDFSLASFDSTALQGTNSSGVISGGVVGGSNAGNPSDLFLTDASQPGGMSRSEDNGAYTAFTQLNAPAAGTGSLDSSKSWEAYVGPTFTTGSVYGESGVNPNMLVGAGTTVFDLWETSSSTITGVESFQLEGYLTLDLSGASPDLTFTAVPEPSSYLICGLGGILMLALRFRPGRRNA